MTGASAWVDIGAAEEATEEHALLAEVAGYPVMILRCGAELHAIEDRCTHDGEPLAGAEVEDCQVICPRHGSRFCLRTGEALTPPAYEPVRTFRVKVDQGRILIEAPQ